MDSLNGACEFAKQDTSPFSTKKHMYGKGEMSDQATQHVSDEVMKRTVSVKCSVQFNAAFVTWSNRFKLSMWSHRFATNRFISHFASPLFAFYLFNPNIRSNKWSRICMENKVQDRTSYFFLFWSVSLLVFAIRWWCLATERTWLTSRREPRQTA